MCSFSEKNRKYISIPNKNIHSTEKTGTFSEIKNGTPSYTKILSS